MSICQLMKAHIRITCRSAHLIFRSLYTYNPFYSNRTQKSVFCYQSHPCKLRFLSSTLQHPNIRTHLGPCYSQSSSIMNEINADLLLPPLSVRGMKKLQRDNFTKHVTVPVIKVSTSDIQAFLNVLKAHLLKVVKFSSTAASTENDGLYKKFYLCPFSYSKHQNKILVDIENLCVSLPAESSDLFQISSEKIELKYENWNVETTLKAILPEDGEVASGYSIIGHILHLNLREHLLPFKEVIGEVLLDKTRASLIVNKIDSIDESDESYRSFKMEVLAGEGTTVTKVKESKCTFEMDFAKVYWNSRLETEHSSVIKQFRTEDVLYDVMAGVGPFSIPAAKNTGCSVLANDLNPESFKWLKRNCELNKVASSVSCYNLDGRDFVRNIVKPDLLRKFQDSTFDNDVYFTMNLPALAIEFLPVFVGLFKNVNIDSLQNFREPIVHVYMFSRDMKASSCLTRVAFYIGLVNYLPDFDGKVAFALKSSYQDILAQKSVQYERPKYINDQDSIDIPGLIFQEIRYVRKVSKNKAMIRVSFSLTKEILISKKVIDSSSIEKIEESYSDDLHSEANPNKKIKLN